MARAVGLLIAAVALWYVFWPVSLLLLFAALLAFLVAAVRGISRRF